MVDFDKHIGLAVEFCKNQFQNYSHLSEDIQQQAYIGLWRACRTFDDTKGYEFSTYAYKCMKNEVLVFLRKENKHTSVIVDTNLIDTQTTQRYSECNKFIKTQSDLLEIVNPKFKETFRLYTEGYKQTEIVEIQGLDKSTVSLRIKDCIKTIKQQKNKK